MKFFSITILSVISILCTSNLHASQLLNKKENEQERQRQLAIQRLEMKTYLASIATYKNFCQIQKSESAAVVTDKKNYEQNEKAATVRSKNKPVLTSQKPFENLFTAIQSDNPDYLQIQLLLKDNSSINLINDQGYTPLQLIVHTTIKTINTLSTKHNNETRKNIANKTEIIKLLLTHGASTSITDLNNQTVKNYVEAALKEVPEDNHHRRRLKRIDKALEQKFIITPAITKEPIKLLN